MVQSQFESAGINSGPPSSPELRNNDGLVKKMIIEAQIKRNAQLQDNSGEPSTLDGVGRVSLVAGSGMKDANVLALDKFDKLKVKTKPPSGKNEMKIADTAGDGIIATASRASASAVAEFAPQPNAGSSSRISEPQSRGHRIVDESSTEVFTAEPTSKSIASDSPSAKSKMSASVAESIVVLKTQTVEAEKTEQLSPELANLLNLQRRMDSTFAEAQRYARAFEHQRAQRQADRDINDINIGRRRFTSDAEKQLAMENATTKKAAAEAALREGVPPRYAQTLKKLHDFTLAVENFYKAETDANKRTQMLGEAVKKVEELMSPIDNIWNGIPGKTPDLARPDLRTRIDKPVWPEERLPQIQEHLYAKINTVDNAQAQRISAVKDNVTVKEILNQHAAGELPNDGSVVFFTSEGTLLYQSELKVSQRSTQQRAKDAASAEKHANGTPAFIDIANISRGLGPEGAGLWRFIGLEDRIVGAAILKPVLKDGKPVELPGSRNGRGKPTIKKEVSATIGLVPTEVTPNMAYGHLLNTLRAKKAGIERGNAPDTVPH
jgi:hypothetical protein